MIDGWGISCKIVLRWISVDLTDDKLTLVQVMAWCRQATSHYLSPCWSRFLSPYDVTRPQWVNQEISFQFHPPLMYRSQQITLGNHSEDSTWSIDSWLWQQTATCLASVPTTIYLNIITRISKCVVSDSKKHYSCYWITQPVKQWAQFRKITHVQWANSI